MQNIVGPQDLIVWQKSVDFSVYIYSISEHFPKTEIYGLTSQMRRASVSVPSNIAEGRRRGSRADFVQFLRIAHGSLAELETQLLISKKLGYISDERYEQAASAAAEISKMLHGMISRLR